MEFTNTFKVNAPVDQVWALLMQPEEVTGCVPGAAITEKIDDQHFKGTVKIKLGAVQVSYRGEMEMKPDEAARTITLSGKGTEARGSGGASGRMTVALSADGRATNIQIDSQVDVTGKVATFGRGIMQDVASRLTRQFGTCLASKLEETAASPPLSTEPDAGLRDSEPSTTGSSSWETPGGSPSAEQDVSPGTVSAANLAPAKGTQELRIVDILSDIARARTAQFLRAVASWVDPE